MRAQCPMKHSSAIKSVCALCSFGEVSYFYFYLLVVHAGGVTDGTGSNRAKSTHAGSKCHDVASCRKGI
jgi:hypothetical protein